MTATKIATCCYCGTRAALVLDRGRHELVCASCGAPLHDMKRLKGTPEPAEPARRRSDRPVRQTPLAAAMAAGGGKSKKKKRKSPGRRMLSEIWDVLDDLLD